MTQLIARFLLFSPYIQCSLWTVTVRIEGEDREWQVVGSSRENATKMIHFIFTVTLRDLVTTMLFWYIVYCIYICFEKLMEIDNGWSWYDDVMISVFTCIHIHIFIFVHIWYILLLSYSILYVVYTGFFLFLPVRIAPVRFAKNLYFRIFRQLPLFRRGTCFFGIGWSLQAALSTYTNIGYVCVMFA